MKYVLYYRVSTKDQGKSGNGLEAQQRDCKIYLENYSPKDEETEVIGEFTDIETGKSNERSQMTAAIKLAKQEGAVLLVAKLDRLSRRVSFIASLMEDKKLTWKVASMPFADSFQLHIYAALAEQERNFISARTKAALAEVKVKRAAAGMKPLGWKGKENLQGQAEKSKAKAETFAKERESILRHLVEQGMTLQAIADELNKIGVKTVRGGVWAPVTVQRMLTRIGLKTDKTRKVIEAA